MRCSREAAWPQSVFAEAPVRDERSTAHLISQRSQIFDSFPSRGSRCPGNRQPQSLLLEEKVPRKGG